MNKNLFKSNNRFDILKKKDSKGKGKLSKLKNMNCFHSKNKSKEDKPREKSRNKPREKARNKPREKSREKAINLESLESFPSIPEKESQSPEKESQSPEKESQTPKNYLHLTHQKDEEKMEVKDEIKEKKGWIVLSVEDGKIQKKYGSPSQWKLDHIESQKNIEEKKIPWYNKTLEEYEDGYDGGFDGCCEDNQDISNEFDIIESPPKEEEYEECEEYY